MSELPTASFVHLYSGLEEIFFVRRKVDQEEMEIYWADDQKGVISDCPLRSKAVIYAAKVTS